MKSRIALILAILVSLAVNANAQDWFDKLLNSLAKPESTAVKKEVAPERNPIQPGVAETHIVELYKVQISDDDFHRSSFGNPLKIRVALLQNGEEIKSANHAMPPILLRGTRGERLLETPIQWVVDFNPEKNYQIVLEEQSIVADAWKWMIPKTPKLGIWPVGVPDGMIHIGKDSYIQFHDKLAKSRLCIEAFTAHET
jgi:hypothetical protein